MSNHGNASSTDANTKPKHSVSIDQRRHTRIVGIEEVFSFHETEIVLKIDTGVMVLTGHGLHVANLSLEEGTLAVEGHVDSVVYESPKKSTQVFHFLKRKI